MTELPVCFKSGNAIAAAARAASIAYVQRGKRLFLRAHCASCPAKQEQPVDFRMESKQMRAVFLGLGWEELPGPRETRHFSGRMICPDCVRARVAPLAVTQSVPPPIREVQTVTTPATNENATNQVENQGEVREPTLVEMRNIMAALETYFVDGVYTNGKSDARIAAELDLPTRMVQNVRIGAFGHIRNAELEQLKQDAAALKAQLTDLFPSAWLLDATSDRLHAYIAQGSVLVFERKAA